MSGSNNSMVIQNARDKLTDSGVLMRYDYAWRASEFKKASDRLTGIACRFLYLHAVWKAKLSSDRQQYKLYAISNGYPDFSSSFTQAAEILNYSVIPEQDEEEQNCNVNVHPALDADVIAIFVPPPGEEKAHTDRESPAYHELQSILRLHKDNDTPTERLPVVIMLLGDSALLPPPDSAETERIRGLSSFAISQQLSPFVQSVAYTSIAHYSIEFGVPDEDDGQRQKAMESMMSDFGYTDPHMFQESEKWEVYAPESSALAKEETTQPDDEETRYWLEYAQGKVCDQCFTPNDKLAACSRCRQARYCSRACQKAGWKLHKRICGKTAEEINAQAK